MRKFFSLLICSVFLFSLCACNNCAHEFGEWKKVKEETCAEEGLKQRVCQKCGKEEEEKIDVLGHDFDLAFSVDIAPTSEQEGLRSRHCRRAGCNAKIDEEVMEKLQKDPEAQDPSDPNPSKPNPSDPNPSDPNPSDPNPSDPNPSDPNPSDPNPSKPDPSKPDPSDPDPSKPNPSDPDPSKPDEEEPEEPGPLPIEPDLDLDEKYGQNMPMDDDKITGEAGADGLVLYRIRINRRNGRKISWMIPLQNNSYSLNYPSIKVTDEKGEKRYEGIVPVWREGLKSEDDAICMLDLKLEKGTYKVELLNLPEGFVYEREYTISSQQPLLDLRLHTKLRASDTKLSVLTEGMVMPDLKIKSLNKGETTLGELLKKNQLVIFTFSSRTCYWCQQEMATLVKMYQKYKGAFTYVFFDTVDTDKDTIMNYLKSPSWYGDLADDFYIVSDKMTDNLYNKFYARGIPTNMFIDSDGYVFLITGGLTEERFERVLYYNLERSET